MSRSNWKRPPTKVYDYNYNIGEHYYRPQLNYVDGRRAGSPPKARTFAERFAADPVYGSYGPAHNMRSTGARRASDDYNYGFRLDDDYRRPNVEDEFNRRTEDLLRRKPMNEFRERPAVDEDEFFRSRFDDRFNAGGRDEDFGRSRFEAGAGAAGGMKRQTSPFRSSAHDDFEEDFFRRPKKPAPRSADPDSRDVDPFKMRNAKALAMVDDFDEDFNSEDVLGRIKSKLKAKREKDEFGFSAMAMADQDSGQSRLDQLRAKNKARMAEFDSMDDDFSALSLGKKRGPGADLGSKYLGESSGKSSSKVHVKKRIVKSSQMVDSD